MSGAGFFLLPFGVHSCQVGLCEIRCRALPNQVPDSYVWGLSLLVEVVLELGRLTCNSRLDPLVITFHCLLVIVLHTLGPARVLLLEDLGLSEGPPRCV